MGLAQFMPAFRELAHVWSQVPHENLWVGVTYPDTDPDRWPLLTINLTGQERRRQFGGGAILTRYRMELGAWSDSRIEMEDLIDRLAALDGYAGTIAGQQVINCEQSTATSYQDTDSKLWRGVLDYLVTVPG